MKTIKQILMFGALALVLNACSSENNNPIKTSADGGAVGTCLEKDSNACAAANSSCVAKCLADEACHKDCENTFCGCMNAAGCGAPAQCKSDVQIDGGTTPNKDRGTTEPDPDQGTEPDPDEGITPDPDQDVSECLQDDINECALTKSTCVAVCVADQECLDDCQTDFCDCMDMAGCQPPAECTI